jgi:quercetin dioxygenase-like cupin family protein
VAEEPPIRRVEPKRRPAPAEWFTGHVEIEPVLGGDAVSQNKVHFHDGAHTNWHLHTGDQVLYFLEGRGMAQAHDAPVLECGPGDIVHVRPGTRHVHGALPGNDATHLAVTQGETIWDNDPRYPEGR